MDAHNFFYSKEQKNPTICLFMKQTGDTWIPGTPLSFCIAISMYQTFPKRCHMSLYVKRFYNCRRSKSSRYHFLWFYTINRCSLGILLFIRNSRPTVLQPFSLQRLIVFLWKGQVISTGNQNLKGVLDGYGP